MSSSCTHLALLALFTGRSVNTWCGIEHLNIEHFVQQSALSSTAGLFTCVVCPQAKGLGRPRVSQQPIRRVEIVGPGLLEDLGHH